MSSVSGAETETALAAAYGKERVRRTLFWMVIAALAVRLAVMAFVYPTALNPARDHWRFGGEAGRIARSLATGEGYSSPYFANTGPTAWLAPVFPLLLAGVFKSFGVYTKGAALAILSLDCLLSALTCIPVFLIARRTFDDQFGERAAKWAGWIWVFFPYSINFAASFIWDTTLSTLLMALLFLAALKLENTGAETVNRRAAATNDSPRIWPKWFAFGALAGFAALSDPVILSVAPFLALWMLYVYWKRGQRWFAPGLAALVAVIVVLSPWFVRNYRTFHKFIPLRSGFWFEVYCGNNADSWHWDPPGYHPSDSATEWSEFQQLGETGYMELKHKEAAAFVSAHKLLYARQTLRRIVYIWTGFWSFGRRYLHEEPADPGNIIFCTALSVLAFLGLRRASMTSAKKHDDAPAGSPPRTSAMPYIIAFVFFPLVYYFTHPEDYYRRPLDPMMVALAAGAIAHWRRNRATQSAAASHLN
ncbi:MAG TPA: hypothetical protein VN745_00210 [Verrucomicrobiae bacterium]|nr:hypothetical protein [Verrucomicrobiae bacterium]